MLSVRNPRTFKNYAKSTRGASSSCTVGSNIRHEVAPLPRRCGGEVGGMYGGGGGTGGGGVGGSHTRRCTQRAVHTQGGAHKRRSVATAGVLLFKGPRARWHTHKAVHTQGGAHKRRCIHKAVHTKGGL